MTGDARPVTGDEAHHVLAAISKSPIFCLLPPARYKKLLPFFGLVEEKKGTTIVRRGEKPLALYMVVTGRVRVGGEPGFSGPGRCFGLTSARAPEPAPATVQMASDGLLAVLTPAKVKVVARAFPELEFDE